jgi:putative ABC transport system permease protein
MGIPILAGREFVDSEQRASVMINKLALVALNLGDAKNAVGKSIIIDSIPATIIGVVEDFHFRGPKYAITPVILRVIPKEFETINIRCTAQDLEEVKALLSSHEILNRNAPVFDYSSYGEIIESRSYKADTRMIEGIAFVSAIIATLGLLAICKYNVDNRVREISIRKLLGASPLDVLKSLSNEFVLLIIFSIALALPLAFFISQEFLTQFAYKTLFDFSTVLIGSGTLLILGSIAVGSQVFKMLKRSPINNL